MNKETKINKIMGFWKRDVNSSHNSSQFLLLEGIPSE
jgi:hypothetical protein